MESAYDPGLSQGFKVPGLKERTKLIMTAENTDIPINFRNYNTSD
jgi:hypothetical protein